MTTARTWRSDIRVARIAAIAVLATLSLVVTACSSSSLPTSDAATQQAEQYVNQALDGIHYSGPRVLSVVTGPCNETDTQHGTVAVWFYFPGPVAAGQSNAIFNSLLAYWRSNGYSGVTSESSKGVMQVAGASQGGYDIGAGLDNGMISMSTGSCYSTPGPTTPVTNTVTATP